MHIAILTLIFSLPGCGLLKEKRHRMGGLHARLAVRQASQYVRAASVIGMMLANGRL